MRRRKKTRTNRLALWIKLGTLALLAGCGAYYSQQQVFIYSAPRFWHLRSSFFEQPAPKYELHIPNHPAVDTWVKWYSEKNRRSFQTHLDRAPFYAVPAQDIFTRKGLPKDLVYIALIESGFSPTARSHANAVGMWQIVPNTGSRFGLAQNLWIDERRHPMKAAKAASTYLSFLYNKFGSWSLALAAYNAGENAVQRALNKSGLNTFWDLMEKGYLPAETCDYVPKVFAAVKIIRSAELYGFHLDPERRIPLQETVSVPGGVKLSWVSKQIGIPEGVLKESNPELNRSITPPGNSKYELHLPSGTADELLTALARSKKAEEKPTSTPTAAKSTNVVTYKVKSGDTLSTIAMKYKSSVTALAAKNGIKPSQPLKAGRTLKIPARSSSPGNRKRKG